MKLEPRKPESIKLALMNVAFERLEALHKETVVMIASDTPVNYLDVCNNLKVKARYSANLADVIDPLREALLENTLVNRTLYVSTFRQYLGNLAKRLDCDYKVKESFNNEFSSITFTVTLDNCIYVMNVSPKN